MTEPPCGKCGHARAEHTRWGADKFCTNITGKFECICTSWMPPQPRRP